MTDKPPTPPQDQHHRPDATDRVVQQDRVMSTEAIMLPIDKKLTADQQKEVRAAVRRWIEDADGTQAITNKQIAEECGLSTAVVSEYMRNKYRGNNDRVARTLNLWLDRHTKREKSQGVRQYVETWVAEEMAAFVRLADRRQKMAAIVSPSGSGKDMVIEALAEELNGVIITANAKTTATRLLKRIATAIGVNVTSDSEVMEQRVVKRLRNRSTILFINEAQQLAGRASTGAACASILRYLYDETHVPIVLFGSAEIFRFIDDRDPASGGGQLYRRCIKVNMLNRARQAEDPDDPSRVGRPLFSRDEVRKFLAMKQVKLTDEDAFQLMWQLANQTEHGTLGLLADVVETIHDLWPGMAIDRELIYSALSILLDVELEVLTAEIEEADDTRRAAAG